jgi:hypothetical protein
MRESYRLKICTAVPITRRPSLANPHSILFVYGHFLRHKENTNEQVHKVIIGLEEAFAGEVQIQFDMPDVMEVAETCGAVMHNKK